MLTGCVQQVFFPQVNEATVRLLTAEGADVVIPRGLGCCGALSLHTGRAAEAARLARRTIEAFEDAGVDVIVVNSAGCGSAMKEYGELFQAAGDGWAERAARTAAKVRDLTEYLAELAASDEGPRGARHPLPVTVAYHDACHLGHAQRIRQQPRDLLRAIPGLQVAELADGGTCCGSAGVYNLLQPEAAGELGARKAAAVLATGAPVVVSANPGCSLQIASAIAATGRRRTAGHHAHRGGAGRLAARAAGLGADRPAGAGGPGARPALSGPRWDRGRRASAGGPGQQPSYGAHALVPDWAYSLANAAFCTDTGAFSGRPEKPRPCQVDGRNPYRPPAPLDGLTADGLPLLSRWITQAWKLPGAPPVRRGGCAARPPCLRPAAGHPGAVTAGRGRPDGRRTRARHGPLRRADQPWADLRVTGHDQPLPGQDHGRVGYLPPVGPPQRGPVRGGPVLVLADHAERIARAAPRCNDRPPEPFPGAAKS